MAGRLRKAGRVLRLLGGITLTVALALLLIVAWLVSVPAALWLSIR